MKKCLIGITLFVFALSFPCLQVIGSESISDDIIKAAKEGIDEYGSSLTELAPVASSDNLSIGKGFRIYTVTPEALFYAKGSDLSEMSIPMDTYQFFVIQKNTPVALMTVAKMDGEWKAVQFGSYDLARELNSIKVAFKKDAATFQFIRIFQATSDFLAVKQNDHTLGFSALNSAVRTLGLEAKRDVKTLIQGSAIINPLRDIVAERLSNDPTLNQF